MSKEKIIHLADVHLMNNLKYQQRQNIVINNTIKQISTIDDIKHIVLVGDLFHDFIKVSNESKALGGKFLNELSKFGKVIIIDGNHDINIKDKKGRLSTVKTVVDLLNNKNIIYFDTTGFYEVDDVVYAVWSHLDKKNPWIEFPEHKKDKNKLYIDLFHDPVYNCKTATNQVFNDDKLVNTNLFKGDLFLLGDIHNYQTFEKNNNILGCYPSSLYQTSFGETVYKHGFVTWNISDKKNIIHTFNEVENPYSFINVYLKPEDSNEIDYDNLNLKNIINEDEIKEYTDFNIHWYDVSKNFNNKNWRLIKDEIKKLYGSKTNIVDIKKKEHKTDNNKIKQNDFIENNIAKITDFAVQKQIFIDFLKEKNYDDNFINEILKIDDIINKRVGYTETPNRVEFELLKLGIENFRSHGDYFEHNFEENTGILQIMGLNANGKTNFLNTLFYLLLGKTLETQKREQNGDLRFINNRNNTKFCQVTGWLRIQGQVYELTRRSEKSFDRSKTKVSGCSTTFTIKMIDADGNEINQTHNEKSETQKIITNLVGSFDDFINLHLINGDTINTLLTLNEAEFLDLILKYSGLNIFQVKLDEYKQYQKSLYKTTEKIVLVVEDELEKINNINLEIDNKKNELKELKEIKLVDVTNRLNKGLSLKEEEIKKLYPIDNSLVTKNIDNIKNDINNLVIDKENQLNNIKILENQISQLRDTYDINTYNKLNTLKETLQTEYHNIKNKIKENTYKIDSIKNDIARCNGNVLNLNKNIDSLNKNIDTELKNIGKNITLKETEINLINKSIESKIENIKAEINILENSKTCPSCGELLKGDKIENIKKKISEKQNVINELQKTINNTEEIKEIQLTISDYKNNLKNKSNPAIDKIKEQIETIKTVDIVNEGKKGYAFNKTLDDIENNILPTLNNESDDISIKISDNKEEITEIEKEKDEFDKRNNLINQKNNIPLIIENIELKIENNQTIYQNVVKELEKVEFNQKIEKVIETYTNRLTILTNESNDIKTNINYIENNIITSLLKDIENINNRLIKFEEQERTDLINKTYMELIHRDGLPKLLLLRMRESINNEIVNLVGDLCDFDLYFDENMSLKMCSHHNNESVQNVINGSGMERTFISILVRLALRNVNNNSLGNFIFLDEITGKLVDESVTKLFKLLHKMKQQIDHIIIIEHAYSDELDVDNTLMVQLNEDGVSEITVM